MNPIVSKANKTSMRLVLVGATLLPASLAFIGCSSERQTASAAPQTVNNISIVSVQAANIPDVVEAVGTLHAAQTSQLAAQMMGSIVEIRAREGDHVQRGQVLAVIDDALPRAVLDRATAAELAAQQEITASESDFTLAEATFKRYQTLFDRKSVSPQEFDEIKARYQASQARREMARAGQSQAKAAVQQARIARSYTQVVAPFAGLVTEKKADVGTLASPGMPIFTVEDLRRYRLEATVNERDLRYVRQGEQVVLKPGDRDLNGKRIEAQ